MLPRCLDHLILGADDLTRGIVFVEERAGIRAAFGGVHPGRGTHNALLSLGPRCYLEILAPDPNQTGLAWFRNLPQLQTPRLVGWMAHVLDIDALAAKLRELVVAFNGPTQNSRVRADGRSITWKLLRLTDNTDGLLPIFIEWSAGSPHPADDAPAGLRLVQFEIASPEHQHLRELFEQLGLDLAAEHGDRAQLRAEISGPGGSLFLSS